MTQEHGLSGASPPFSRALMQRGLKSASWIALTFISKFLGMTREFALLAVIGIGATLDNFLFFLNGPVLIVTLVGGLIYTSLTPILAKREQTDAGMIGRSILADSIRMGAALTGVALTLNLALYGVLLQYDELPHNSLLIAVACPLAVFFTVIAEHFSAWLTAHGRTGYIVSGNILISLPPVFALVFLPIDITSYTVIFIVSFFLRSVWLMFGMRDRLLDIRLVPGDFRRRLMLMNSADRHLLAGAPMLVLQVVLFLPILLARAFEETSVSLYFYALKAPQFYLTTVWFVLGVQFFKGLQTLNLLQAQRALSILVRINAAIIMVIGLAVYGLSVIPFDRILPARWLEQIAFVDLLSLWLFALPIALFASLTDGLQKYFATFQLRPGSRRLAVVLTLIAVPALIAAMVWGSVEALLLAALVTTGCGSLIGWALLMRQTRTEKLEPRDR